MPNRSSKPKRPRDPNQLAKLMVDIATGKKQDIVAPKEKNAAAVALGRMGDKKGGLARAAKLSEKRRREIATKAAAVRWAAKSQDEN